MRSHQSGLSPSGAADEPLQTKGARAAARELFEHSTPKGSGNVYWISEAGLSVPFIGTLPAEAHRSRGIASANPRLMVGFDAHA